MRRRSQWLLGSILVASLPRFAAAQDGATARAADPVPGVARAEEVWTAAPPGSGLLRRLKHLSLLPSDRVWVTFGGSLRLRGSDTRNYLFSPAAGSQDDFTEMRTLLSADLWVGERNGWHARGFAEWRDAQGFGRTLPGGVRTNEADRADWQSEFVEIGYRTHSVRLGVQDVGLGRERLVGYSDWSNSRRSFEGLRFFGGRKRLRWDAFSGRVMAIRSNEANEPDTLSRLAFSGRVMAIRDEREAREGIRLVRLVFVAITLTGRPQTGDEWRLAGTQAYLISAKSDAGAALRRTFGTRLQWDRRAPTRDWSAEFEGAMQGGELGARQVQAWFGVGEGSVTWRDVRFVPSATAAVEIASGMRDDSAFTARTFVPPYATSHSHNGIADVFGRTNLRELRVGGGVRPFKDVQVVVLARRFDRVRIEDGAYTKSNAVLRPASGGSRSLGAELDLTANWTPSPRVRVLGGAAWVTAGDFIEQTGDSAPVRWAFLSTVLAF